MDNQELPGIKGESFSIQIDKGGFNSPKILSPLEEFKLIVTKVYPYTWWRRFLLFLGFSVKFYDVKLEPNESNQRT